MKKLLSLLMALVMALSLAACGGKEEPVPEKEEAKTETETPSTTAKDDLTQGDPITWILPQTLTEGHPGLTASFAFADAMAEATGGRWTIEVYAGGSMGSENETLEMCRANTIQLVPANLTTMEQYIPDFGVFALPYLFRSWEDFNTYLTESEKCAELWDQLEESTGLRFVSCVANGSRCLSTVGIAPVKQPSDLAGVKIRSMEAPVWKNIISALGGTPIAVSFTELYVALQTGVVSGQDNPLAIVYANKFYEVLDDIYMTEHCYNTSSYYVSSQAWNALTTAEQELFTELWQKYMVDYYNEIFPAYEQESINAIEAADVTIWQKEDLNMDAFYASADEMIEREYMSNELYAGYITDIREMFNY